jgi:protein ImuB
MRRVISLWLPNFATDRIRKSPAAPDDAPVVVSMHDGRRRVVAAVDEVAAKLGLRAGMALAQAQSLVPGLAIHAATPEHDAEALRRVAAWCLRYAPLVAPAPPDGVFIDATGAAHLHGGETALLRDLLGRLLAQGLMGRAAIADTPGAAHAVARFGAEDIAVVPVGGAAAALRELPIASLRLPGDSLRRLGLDRVGQLAVLPRAPLTRRFGPSVALRLDQALGTVFEPIVPQFPPELIQAHLRFVEPLLTAEAFSSVIARLMTAVCADLEASGQGARRLDLVFERVDGSIQVLRIGTARASRDAGHLARMLDERLERVDPGLGVEAMRLVAPRADRLAYAQTAARLRETDGLAVDISPAISPLIDRLSNRMGTDRVYRLLPVESDVPERSVRRMSALGARGSGSWPTDLPRPVRLLHPPQAIEAMALLPDRPPVAFVWRRVRHRVRHADGPERIAGEWWKRDGEMRSVRDYFQVEDDAGRRFWLFRRGDGEDLTTGDMCWFLHGLF